MLLTQEDSTSCAETIGEMVASTVCMSRGLVHQQRT